MTRKEDRCAKYGTPLKESQLYEYWLNKSELSIREYACIANGIDPASFDDSPEATKVYNLKVKPFVEDILRSVNSQKVVTQKDWDDLPF